MSRSSLTEFALANPLYVWVIVLTCLVGGLAGGQRIAQLEDPPYPIKIAYVFTEYPGASTLDVEQEVTEVLEARSRAATKGSRWRTFSVSSRWP